MAHKRGFRASQVCNALRTVRAVDGALVMYAFPRMTYDLCPTHERQSAAHGGV